MGQLGGRARNRVTYKGMGMCASMTSRVQSFISSLLIMHLLSTSAVAAYVLCSQAIIAAPTELSARDLDSFISSERDVALQGALNNIGPDGSAVPGAGAGFVVASPSKVNPNCQFRSLSLVH